MTFTHKYTFSMHLSNQRVEDLCSTPVEAIENNLESYMNLPLSCDETLNEAITVSNTIVTGETVEDFAS